MINLKANSNDQNRTMKKGEEILVAKIFNTLLYKLVYEECIFLFEKESFFVVKFCILY